MKSPLILLVLSCTVVLAQVGVNLVRNPGFEEIAENGFPAEWHISPWVAYENSAGMSAGAPLFQVSTQSIFEGTRSLHYSNQTPGGKAVVSQNIPARPGKTYEFSICVRQVNQPDAPTTWPLKPRPGFFLEYHANGRYLTGKYDFETVQLENGWGRLIGRAVIPEEATETTIAFRAQPDGTTAAEFWFDSCAVVEILDETLPAHCITDQYRDMADGGQVTILQRMTRDAVMQLQAGRATIRMEILDAGGNIALSLVPAALRPTEAAFTFDAGVLSSGTYALRGLYANAESGASQTSFGTFTKVEKLPEFRTYVDEHRRLIVDGKPFFPLG
ncbi:MAG: carbohydrate binding domain-containing protein, partial [Victivallales bacterium]|nr:carbohydrate binding domain-containing protein [Victivallales bacterium]